MTDKKITELTNITGANLVDADEFVVVDISADETKAITLGELKEAFDSGSGFVRVTGDTMTGDLALSGADVTFGDNDKAIFGAGSDLQIYHDGLNSYIDDAGTGALRIRAQDLLLADSAGNPFISMIDLGTGGSVSLRHNTVEKLVTTSTGIDVTGTVAADSLTVEDADGATIRIQSSDTSVDGGSLGQLEFYSNDASTGGTGVKGKIQVTDVSSYGTAYEMNFFTGYVTGGAHAETKKMSIGAYGDISFYEDQGTTPKFYWSAANERLGIGTSSPQRTLHVHDDSTYVQLTNDTTGTTSSDGFRMGYFTGQTIFTMNQQENDGFAFSTNNAERMRIDSSGNLLVGKTSSNSIADDGIQLSESGQVIATNTLATANSGQVAIFNRKSTDGPILDLRKNGATVGIIGVASSNLTLTGFGSTIRVGGSTAGVWPDTDNTLSVGTSASRFKDLYLSGGIEIENGTGNVGVGKQALNSNTASNSTAVGYQAGYSATTGGSNSYVGQGAGYTGTTSYYNVAMGNSALYYTTTGASNVAIGVSALQSNTTASNSTAVGYQAAYSNTTGAENTALGNRSLYTNTIGTGNVAVGHYALNENSTAAYNTGVGYLALRRNTTGASNVSLGYAALTSNTTANENTAVGYQAGYSNTTSSFSTFIGKAAGYSSTGAQSTYVGEQSGYYITTGAKNTIIGRYNGNQGGLDIRTSDNNIVLSDGDGNPRLNIDSVGRTFIGNTNRDTNPASTGSSSNEGITLGGPEDPYISIGRTNNAPLVVGRIDSSGENILLYVDGNTLGSIGSYFSGSVFYQYIAGSSSQSCGIGFYNNGIYPSDYTGAFADNSKDLGAITTRWDDVYATNGTIQTSDRNEKQDIEALSDAEQRVAVACKGLLRKFRWIDSVAEKGDDARIHFGIIAQDLQDAFAAEGLDAGRYAMFISTTWWEAQTEVPAVEADEENGIEAKEVYTRTDTYKTLGEAPEGATERTRLGVRYPELLAFIIASI